MPVSAVADVFASTMRMDIHEVVRRMNSHLGATLVAALAGSRDSKLPYRWAKDTTPNAQAEARLRMAHRVWSLIADAESDHVARSWFIGANPLLEELSPVLALREDKLRQVSLAAQAFVEDSWGA
ncbi:hypothetical protein CFK39_06900 [Brachybacterium avium]|uniref:Uncharacterized protein n=1 Tax=Brachybacterium avium TaxID=2017485 RepID=A0A220UBL6_9MICO|nr:hypothetical protein [Brachybacterium avium]ASK65608.1 hypothetical protein CFK39_06900 [Brachybacterium avium]